VIGIWQIGVEIVCATEPQSTDYEFTNIPTLAVTARRLKPRLRGRFAPGDRLRGRCGSVYAGGRPAKSPLEAISIAESQQPEQLPLALMITQKRADFKGLEAHLTSSRDFLPLADWYVAGQRMGVGYNRAGRIGHPMPITGAAILIVGTWLASRR
jgi:hypothetical protein